jgi:DNA replication protein DnaC
MTQRSERAEFMPQDEEIIVPAEQLLTHFPQLLPVQAQKPEGQKKDAQKSPKKRASGRKIGLRQLSQKTYSSVDNLPDAFTRSFGDIEDAFDCIIYGNSGNGKTNFTVDIIKCLVLALKQKCMYISYEEGHTKTLQKTMIERHDMLNLVGNLVEILDHATYEELEKLMSRKRSPKVYVIDSLQASRLTEEQCASLKQRFVMSRKKKILIYISWADGKRPKGAVAQAVEYYAHVKIRVEGFIAFFKSRFGGNRNYVVWEEGARRYWQTKPFNKHKNG